MDGIRWLVALHRGKFFCGYKCADPEKKDFLPNDLGFIRMVPVNADSASLEALWLFGASYTFESGQTVTSEYVFNSAGYSREEAESYYQYRRVASRFYGDLNPLGDLSKLALLHTLDPKLRLLRQHYLMLQYQEAQIWEKLNLIDPLYH